MISSNQAVRYTGKFYDRASFIHLLETALAGRSYRFARQAALSWLAVYPGDLGMNLLLAKSLLGDGKQQQALTILEKLCRLDPEYAAAWAALAQAEQKCQTGDPAAAWGCAQALGESAPALGAAPEWGKQLQKALELLGLGQVDQADALIHQAVVAAPDSTLAAAVHLQLTAAQGDVDSLHQLAELYHDRWPECLQFALRLAETHMQLKDDTEAVRLLHHCVSNDATGQVPERLWGKDHRFRALWPDNLEIEFDQPIPAEVALLLGWNRLPAAPVATTEAPEAAPEAGAERIPETAVGETAPAAEAPGVEQAATEPVTLEAIGLPVVESPSKPVAPVAPTQPEPGLEVDAASPAVAHRVSRRRKSQKKDESLQPVSKEFERLAKKMKQPAIARTDSRFPMYVIFTSHAGLLKQYGNQTAVAIESEMKALAEIVKRRPGWGSLAFIPDEFDNANKLGVSPVSSVDPWKLKLSLADLDNQLAGKGAMIGAVLIVGGPDVVPFHHLPNPTDDDDSTVYSDNPYATLDSNYFVPEWPVGRLPGESGPDAGLLLEQLRGMKIYHSQFRKAESWWEQVFFFLNLFRKRNATAKKRTAKNGANSFGYSAAVWRNSSLEVYKPIGDAQRMFISPPTQSGGFDGKKITDAFAGYYNLHGVPDGADWFGQRDLSDSGAGPDYPVALSPKDLVKNGRAPGVVFSEACYGGYILNKTQEQAIALRFLEIGSQAFVGSTCVAYGSVDTPLIGADLLGYLFWKNLREGLTAGEALMAAKVQLSSEMLKRQGFLDGEDQKTLLSFVLYGDPLVRVQANGPKSKGVVRFLSHPGVKTICDRQDGEGAELVLPGEVLREVKRAVENYLPGLEEAEVIVSQEHTVCNGQHHHCPTSELATKNSKTSGVEDAHAGRMVVTISKQVRQHEHVHHHYARATLDAKGNMVKLAISR